MVISNITRPYGAMIDDDGNFGFIGFGLLGLWVFFFFFFFLLVFLVLLRMGFLVFDFFCGFGCDRGLWLKWRFVGCVADGLLAVVVIVVGYVGGCGCVGLWLWLCWWWFDFFFFFSCHGLWLSHRGCC